MQHEVGKDCPDKTPKDTWSNEQEHVLKTWGEEAKGYAWMQLCISLPTMKMLFYIW